MRGKNGILIFLCSFRKIYSPHLRSEFSTKDKPKKSGRQGENTKEGKNKDYKKGKVVKVCLTEKGERVEW